MPEWATFLGIAGVVLVLLLVLSHLTQSAVTDGERASSGGPNSRPDASTDATPAETPADADGRRGMADADRVDIAVDLPPRDGESGRRPSSTADPNPIDSAPQDSGGGARAGDGPPTTSPASSAVDSVTDAGSDAGRTADATGVHDPIGADADRLRPAGRAGSPESLSTGMVLLNVALSQGLFAVVLLGAAIYAAIPASALGIAFSATYLETGLLWGAAVGVAFYVANEFGAAAATRVGFDHDEGLRELLAPDSIRGWVLLVVGVLPIIAFFEEFLFRAALIGVPAAGYGVSPWVLAVVSSVAFALGHGMQGSVGVVVTGLLGFGLAAVFIVTESLLVVVVAHYLVNALEFLVHEGFDIEWIEPLEE